MAPISKPKSKLFMLSKSDFKSATIFFAIIPALRKLPSAAAAIISKAVETVSPILEKMLTMPTARPVKRLVIKSTTRIMTSVTPSKLNDSKMALRPAGRALEIAVPIEPIELKSASIAAPARDNEFEIASPRLENTGASLSQF